MLNEVYKETEEKMNKVIDYTRDKMAGIRAGRANVNMLDMVFVNYYGSNTSLKELARLSAPEPRVLIIDPFDKGAIKDIEKGIQASGLGLTPSNDGKIIRIMIPELTEDRRKEYLKLAKKESEDGKVGVRNVRKDINNKLRKLQKDGDITEDDLKAGEAKVQVITDKFIVLVDEIYAKKEKELLGK